MNSFYRFGLFLFCLMLSQAVYSQNKDALPHELMIAYEKLIPHPQEVYSGGQYAVGKAFHIDGTAYLESSEFTKGNIIINGLSFDNILLNYDIQKDQLVTYHPNNFQRIIINANKVDSFTLADGRYFIRSNGNNGYYYHKSGFYEVLLDGEVVLLAKHFKVDELKKDLGSELIKKFYFVHLTHYFIKLDDEFYRINNKRDLSLTLGIPKKQINKLLKKSRLKFKKQTAESLVAVVQAYASNLSKD